ncbi:acidic mammalian chitinase-like [Penaeus japonicus]|uniref:acidic mammalian chitinase-like n=1 Tax=Penaeus japonicus TaxID=27405 RepID=UPI001C70DF4C|nr:acidic mammalian chitinase-like [Penaeus japonicus]
MTVWTKSNLQRHGVKLAMVVVLWLCAGYIVWQCSADESRTQVYRDGLVKNQLELTSGSEAERQTENKVVDNQANRVCYYALPHVNTTVANLSPRNIPPDLCTHIIIIGANIQNNKIVPVEENDLKVYAEILALKKINPSLRVLLCLGGDLSELVRDPKSVAVFAYNAQQFLIANKLDGIDLDWEFPAWPAWKKTELEKKWFTYLVLQLNNALKLAAHPPFLLSIAVGAPKPIVDHCYEVDQLAKYVDFVSIMGYDYHMYQTYLPFTGHNAPLAKRHDEIGYFSTLNIEWATRYWLQKGMPKEKLLVGIPTYGRTWRLLSSAWHNVGAPAVGIGMLEGSLTYTEGCIFVKEGATAYFDDESKVPYAVRGTDWVSYENPASIRAKAEWIKASGVAGVMTFDLNTDDFAGLCSGKKFELHNIIKDIFSA